MAAAQITILRLRVGLADSKMNASWTIPVDPRCHRNQSARLVRPH
jgi:hypothetical protein